MTSKSCSLINWIACSLSLAVRTSRSLSLAAHSNWALRSDSSSTTRTLNTFLSFLLEAFVFRSDNGQTHDEPRTALRCPNLLYGSLVFFYESFHISQP